jgi:hypothetical protein
LPALAPVPPLAPPLPPPLPAFAQLLVHNPELPSPSSAPLHALNTITLSAIHDAHVIRLDVSTQLSPCTAR